MASTVDKTNLAVGNVRKLIVRLAIPLICAELINALYNIIDRVYIGHIPEVGAYALTGVGLTFPIIMCIAAFAALWGMGGAPLCSIARGEGRDEYAEQILGQSTFTLIITCIVVTAVGLIFRTPLLYAFGASADTFVYANDYITWYIGGCFTVMLTIGLNPFLTAQGFARTGMITVLTGAVANLILDPIFIFGLHMGVRGAALATVIAQFISFLWVLRFLLGNKTKLKLRAKNLKPNGPIIKRIFMLGLSQCIMRLTESAVQIVCNVQLQRFGGDMALGAMTLLNTVRQMSFTILNGFGSGMQPVMGFNYGARIYSRVREAYKFTVTVTFIYDLIIFALVECFPRAVIGIFTNDEALIQVAVPAMRIFFCFVFLVAFQTASQMSFIALNKPKFAIFFSLLRKVCIVIPLALILPNVHNLGATGVFMADPISDIIGPAACFLTFIFTVWRKLKNMEDDPVQQHLT